jgi:hypothetical protein
MCDQADRISRKTVLSQRAKRYMSSSLYSILQLQHLSTPTLSVLVAITLSSVPVTILLLRRPHPFKVTCPVGE